MASGEMSEEEFVGFLRSVFGNLVTHSADGSLHFICIDWRHLWELLSALRAVYTELKNICVWNKDNGGQGALYRSKHELILVAKSGRARISTMSSSGGSFAIARTCGTTPESLLSPRAAR